MHLMVDKFLCTKCGRKFSKRNNAERHYIVMHTPAKEIRCQVCLKKFKSAINCDVHQARIHGMYKSKKKREEEPFHLPPKKGVCEVKEDFWSCLSEDANFKKASDSHQAKTADGKISKQPDSLQEPHPKSAFPGNQGPETLDGKGTLIQVSEAETAEEEKSLLGLILGDGSYKCSKCGYKTKYRHHAMRHYRNLHLPTKKAKCHVCQKMYKNATSRDHHRRGKHGITKKMMRVMNPTAEEKKRVVVHKLEPESESD